ncbi:MAG: phosphonate metabolism protein/1,5-bisphosphokinase (PRPP-forming) PhnN [Rhodospirillales bacterium]
MTKFVPPEDFYPGVLFLVVGPSGAGKDSIIAKVKELYNDSDEYVFPQRAITRPEEAGGEDHRALSVEEFGAEEAVGLYALTWRAHGLAYGIPETIEEDLKANRTVIINVSRSIIDTARRKFSNVRVISVNAPANVIAARLKDRGREGEQEIEERLGRAEAYTVVGSDVIEIMNDSTIEGAVEKFVAALQETTPRFEHPDNRRRR